MSEIRRTLSLIQKDFNLPSTAINELQETNLGDLKKYLESAISELLDNNFSGLVNAMYRIDISEKQLADALNTPDPTQVASKISEIVIHRELQKVRTRKWYSGS